MSFYKNFKVVGYSQSGLFISSVDGEAYEIGWPEHVVRPAIAADLHLELGINGEPAFRDISWHRKLKGRR